MKEQPSTKVTYFRNRNFKHKMKRLHIPRKLLYEKFYVTKKILRIRNCRPKLNCDCLTTQALNRRLAVYSFLNSQFAVSKSAVQSLISLGPLRRSMMELC